MDSTDYNYVTPNKVEENYQEAQGNEYTKLNRDDRQQSNKYQKTTGNNEDEVKELYVDPEPQLQHDKAINDSDRQYINVGKNDKEEQVQYLDVVSHQKQLGSDIQDTVERTPQSQHIHQNTEELEIYEN